MAASKVKVAAVFLDLESSLQKALALIEKVALVNVNGSIGRGSAAVDLDAPATAAAAVYPVRSDWLVDKTPDVQPPRWTTPGWTVRSPCARS